MRYERPIDLDDTSVPPLLDLWSFDEVPASRINDTIRLIPKESLIDANSRAADDFQRPTFTAIKQHDQLLFPVRPQRLTVLGHYEYISVKLGKPLSRPPRGTTSYTDVEVRRFSPQSHPDSDSLQGYTSKLATGMNVDLIKGLPGQWTIYINGPTSKSYGTMADLADSDWMSGQPVGEGQMPYVTEDGSLCFEVKSGEWYGWMPPGNETGNLS